MSFNSTKPSLPSFADISADLTTLLRQSDIVSKPEFTEFCESRLKLLAEFNIEKDIQKLETEGIRRGTIAWAVLGIKMAPGFDQVLLNTFGNQRQRQQHLKQLLAPVPTLEKIAALLGNDPEMIPETFRPNPKQIADDLNTLAMWVRVGEVFCFFGIKTLLETAKFALAALVKDVTGKYHDKEVSALTGAALHSEEYDETAHRVWRIRNFNRLKKGVPWAPLILKEVNTALGETRPS